MSAILSIENLKKPIRLLNHIGLKLSYKLRLKHVALLPTVLDIEPNNWCNFKCDHCQVTHWSKPKSELSKDSFKQILNQFPNLLFVKLQGMGEPFLNKSTIDMLEILDKKEISATTISNGSVMTDKLIKKLSSLKKTSISFSMDGATKNTFEGIRIKGDFDKVTDNIKKLIKNSPNLKTAFWVVLSKNNVKECESLVDVAKELGVPEVTFQTYMNDWGKDEMKEKNNSKLPPKNKIQTYIDQALLKGEQVDVRVNSFTGNYLTVDKPCQWPWTSLFVDASANVVPCCLLADSNTLNFGNLLETNIKDIWNSNEYKDFRQMHKEGNIPDVCKSCYQTFD